MPDQKGQRIVKTLSHVVFLCMLGVSVLFLYCSQQPLIPSHPLKNDNRFLWNFRGFYGVRWESNLENLSVVVVNNFTFHSPKYTVLRLHSAIFLVP